MAAAWSGLRSTPARRLSRQPPHMLLLQCIVAAAAPACGSMKSTSAGGPRQPHDSVSIMCSSRGAFRHAPWEGLYLFVCRLSGHAQPAAQ